MPEIIRRSNGRAAARGVLAAAVALTVAALCAAPVSAQVSVWTGTVDDNWFNAGNWTNGVPNAATFDAVVGAPAPANMTGSITILSLDLLADGVLNVGNSSNFNFDSAGSLSNAGQINIGINTDFQLLNNVINSGDIFVNGTSSTSDLELLTDTTLTGGGTITLGGDNARSSDSVGAILRLTNSDNTIQGVGQIGANTIAFTNAGLVDANGGGTLTVNTDGSSFNTGTMQASAGTLVINSSNFDNTGGTIASAGGQVQLVNASITGGNLTGGDFFVTNSSNTDLFDLTTDATIQVGVNTDLGVNGLITNNGLLTVNGSSSTSDIELQTDTTFAGTGTIFLDGGTARISDSDGAALLFTNGANHTVRGNGDIGANTIDILNNGLITADVNTGQMTIDPAATFTNNGTLQAEGGGTLELRGGAFANAGATIQALAGSVVELDSEARITGGTLTGAGNFVVPNSVNAGIIDLTTSATIGVGINTDFEVTGTITNNGLLTVNGSSSTSDIELQTDTTFAGNGTIFLDGGTARISDSVGPVLLFTNGAAHTVRGNGQIGANTIDILNNGLITADVAAGTMTLDPASTFTNNNLLRAENGGILQLNVGNYLNNGTIASAGGQVQLVNASITGGNLTGANFLIPNSVNTDLFNLTTDATIQVGVNTDLGVNGLITNNGLLTVNGSSSTSDIELQTDTTFAGTGTIFLDGGTARISDSDGAALLFTNGTNHTVRGNGQIGANTIDILNNGLVTADVAAGTMTLDPATAAGGLVNNGTLAASNGGTLQAAVGTFANDGTLHAGANSLINFNNTLTNSPSAAMIGDGTIAANGLITNGGLIAPGELTLDSDVDFTGTSLLSIEIGGLAQGTEFDHLIITDDLLLDGELSLSVINGFTPDAADTFIVTSAAFLDGGFDNVANGGVLLTDNGLGSFVVNYGTASTFDPNAVVLSGFVAIPEPATTSLLIPAAGLLLSRRRRIA